MSAGLASYAACSSAVGFCSECCTLKWLHDTIGLVYFLFHFERTLYLRNSDGMGKNYSPSYYNIYFVFNVQMVKGRRLLTRQSNDLASWLPNAANPVETMTNKTKLKVQMTVFCVL